MKRIQLISLVVASFVCSFSVQAQERAAPAPASAPTTTPATTKDCPHPAAGRHNHGAERNYGVSLSRTPCELLSAPPKKPLHDHRQVHKQ